jgi:hypothetical protein
MATDIATALILIVLCVFVIWPFLLQIPRVFWPVRLDSSASRFTGLYRRYRVVTVTGHASDIRTFTTVGRQTGSVSGSAVVTGSSAQVRLFDTRRNWTTDHTTFFVQDASGATAHFDAANVNPAVGEGHLVSVAHLVHNRKAGNAFVVYNHTTGNAFVERISRGQLAPRRGLVRMMRPLSDYHIAGLTLLIVTIPIVLVIGLGLEGQLRWFQRGGVRPLLAVMQAQAAKLRAAPVG